MQVIATHQCLANLVNSSPEAREALNRFLYDKGRPCFVVAEPARAVDLTRPPEEDFKVADMALKCHEVRFERRTRDTVYLTASKEALADISEWVKV